MRYTLTARWTTADKMRAHNAFCTDRIYALQDISILIPAEALYRLGSTRS